MELGNVQHGLPLHDTPVVHSWRGDLDGLLPCRLYPTPPQSRAVRNAPEEVEVTLSRELLDHLVASHDASGITLTYLMHELSQRRALQRALRQELHYIASDSVPFAQRDLDTLPLLDAILMETLRLYSANPGPWPRRVPAPGCRVGPFSNIPTGTIVSASSYTLHRNAAVFSQPEQWRPERWLDASVEKRSEMMRWFWAFGSGARMCLGKHFAVQSTFCHE